MEIKELKRENNLLTAALKGRMDAITATEFTTQLESWIEEKQKNFTIDCSQLDYISSAGLRAILIIAKKVRALDGQLQLAALQESVQTVFEISGFDKIIPIFASLDDAATK
ncbi:MAG: STAS domain-containing protein [Deltaproteobacteria bacterium]|nr:STAS domain-containing protein [Candidatus Tharpella sp.]